MTHHIRLRPSGHAFDLEGRESVLDAALRAGIHLDHGCASGNCGQCLARLVSGNIAPVRNSDYRLSAAEKSQDLFLACVNTAASDLVIAAPEATSAADVPLQQLRATLKRVQQISPCFSLVRLQTPRSRLLRFLAGQRVHVTLDTGASGEHYIASCPCDGRNLDILVRREQVHAGRHPLERASLGTRVMIEGPYGDFLLDEESHRPHVFVALGAGMGPVLSLVEQTIAVGRAKHIDLYRIDSCAGSGYLDNLCRSWQDALDSFRYHRVTYERPCRHIFTELESHEWLADAELFIAGPPRQLTIVEAAFTSRPYRVRTVATA